MKYEVLPLPYSFSSLEPYIDEETMRVHYNKHYKGYTEKLNQEIEKLGDEYPTIESLLSDISKLSNGLRNNGGGFYNHTLFFKTMSPGGTVIKDSFKKKIEMDFDCTFEEFKKKFKEESMSRFGSGWCWLCSDSGALKICSTPNQDNPLMDIHSGNGIPIMGIDLWEHSYYLKYKNRRDDYIESFFNVIDWERVEENYENA